MSRMYIVNHWNNAAAYSGEQIGDRLKDSTALHFNRDGSANVNLYSEETALAKKKTSVPLTDRILPQARRLTVLREQMLELEAEYRNGTINIENYSLLRDVIFAKIQRQEILYKRAASVKPKSYEPEEQDYEETNTNSYDNQASTSYKGDDAERRDSWVKLRINVPKDLVFFLTGSVVVLVLLTWIAN